MAAELGKRMRPLTATRPKPLVEVAGQPLIDHVFDRLRSAGVKRAVVNVHYLADPLDAHLKIRIKGIDIVVSNQRDRLMLTGGRLIHARDLRGDALVLVLNTSNLLLAGPPATLPVISAGWYFARV